MQLKEYQQRPLTTIRGYLEHLAAWRDRAEKNPDLELDFPSKAWEKTVRSRQKAGASANWGLR